MIYTGEIQGATVNTKELNGRTRQIIFIILFACTLINPGATQGKSTADKTSSLSKVKDYLLRRKINIVKDWTDIRKIDRDFSDTMANDLIRLYMDGEFDKIYLVYNHFHSAVKQIPVFEEFLPIKASGEPEGIDYLYEPEKEKIIEALIPKYISTKIYFALLDSQTSEHAARMAAMENATSNCGEMINHLTLVYNKRRQESITNEMMDIVGGAEALRGT
jgi:F-type H+-transporting ATPase subunit gamma